MKKLTHSIEQFLEEILLALPVYIIGVLAFIAGIYIIKFIVRVAASRFEKRDLDQSLRGFLLSLIKISLYIVLIVLVTGIMGFKSMSLTAIFGAAGLTIGLALQGSLSNFAGVVLILLFKPFKVGDYISNSDGTTGTVNRIDLLYTTLTNDDGLVVFSPNGALANSTITNYSEINSRRYSFVIGISYDTDMQRAREVILNALDKNQNVQKKPDPLVFVKSLADQKVEINIIIWMKKEVYWDTVFSIQQYVAEALNNENIKAPVPKTEVRVTNSTH